MYRRHFFIADHGKLLSPHACGADKRRKSESRSITEYPHRVSIFELRVPFWTVGAVEVNVHAARSARLVVHVEGLLVSRGIVPVR